MKFGIGQPVRRREDVRFLTGAGRYVDDIQPETVLFMHVLRSDVPHGHLREVDISDARQAPGVVRVWMSDDIAGRIHPIDADMPLMGVGGRPFGAAPQPHLARGKVRYVGEPIAVVLANSVKEAMDAAELIRVEVDDVCANVDTLNASNAPDLHEHLPGNRLFRWEVGDEAATAAAFERAETVVEVAITNQRLVVNALEPRGIVVDPGGEATRIWVSNQGVHAARNDITRDLARNADTLQVLSPDVGGGFGMKLINHPEYSLAVALAEETGQPVKWTAGRSESFLADVQARDLHTRAEGAFDAKGRLLGLRWHSTSNVGAYTPGYGAAVHTMFSGHLIGGVYDVSAVHHVVEGVVTNSTPVDAYRGAGKPEVLHVMERLMSAAARRIGLDQVEIRRRNLIRPYQIPYTTAGGIEFDALDAPAVLDKAIAAADWAGFPARAQAARSAGRLAGIGLAYYYERTGGGPVERGRIEMQADGTILAHVGTQSSGQGHETAWAQVIADQLGVPFDSVRIEAGDSAALPDGGGTGGSRSAVQASRVFLRASEALVDAALDAATELLEVARPDLAFDREAGAIRIAGTDRAASLQEVAAHAGGLTATGAVDDKITTTPNGAHIAEVEVDTDTGEVRLTRYTVVDDFGRVINPMIVTGQVHGGVTQGIGQVLGEAMVWNEDGQPLAASYMDYRMPRAADLPFFDVELVELPTPSNPLGLKGCGEAGSVAAVGATANAVMDALALADVHDLAPPYTPVRVWEALNHR
ncbi:xanthine dehydrogenase family protein molybdopterin-binding subunit [Pontivivens ytuae]|uniref:Xanthine dehydrogenase family protein molybdopterin-binding subunit n=1 Tax=Pontivivens ytuae TaxID=2789856 RepID=A0A7S9LUF8_9RHOB|nr:xanthine dehydrogenase family protein molybdopterin-binding subunit [Pontivivens ytuae]